MAVLTPGNIFTPCDNFDVTTGDASEISATDGATVQTLPFDKATKGDILPSGIFALAVEAGSGTFLESFSIYAADGVLITAVTSYASPARSALAPVFAWGENHFFFLMPPPQGSPSHDMTLFKILDDGTQLDSWILPTTAYFADNMAISPGGDICYYSFENGDDIFAYDLINSVALPNIITNNPTYDWGYNIVIAPNGDLLIPADAAFTNYLLHFSPSGTLINAFAADLLEYEAAEIFTDPDPLYVWLRTFPEGDGLESTFWRFLISDGTSTSFTVDTLEGSGVVPSTCPNFITRSGVEPPPEPPVANPGSGIYQVVPGKTNDTLYVTQDPVVTEDVAIPNPSATTFLFG